MLGIEFLKTGPTQYVLHYRNGSLKRAGPGLAFYYFKPAATIAVVPVGSADVPFIFNEISADYQPVTVQGQLTYRVNDPQRVAGLLDFTIAGGPEHYRSDDPQKLAVRLVNLAQVLVRAELQSLSLREAIHASERVAGAVLVRLTGSQQAGSHADLQALGVEVLALSIQAIRPTPEMARALEAEAREGLLQRADDAIYVRRNAALEQERRIKENELNTEIAVEQKKRQISETKVEAQRVVEIKEQQVRELKLSGQITLENQRQQLVSAEVENARAAADVQAYAVRASLSPLQELTPEVLDLLAVQSADPRRMVSMAFKEIASNAGKIGNLNISPDLFQALMER
jgi:hypothetical protein